MDRDQADRGIPRNDWAFLGLNLILVTWVIVDIRRDGGNIVPWVALTAGSVGFVSWAAWRKIKRAK